MKEKKEITMKSMLIGGMVAASMLLGTSAFAGYNGPSATDTTMKTPDVPPGFRHAVAMNYHMPDNAQVTLEGFIVNHRRGDYYTFRDRSGLAVLEIKPRTWKGLDVDDRTRIKVYGKVEKNKNRLKIAANNIELAPRNKGPKQQKGPQSTMNQQNGGCR